MGVKFSGFSTPSGDVGAAYDALLRLVDQRKLLRPVSYSGAGGGCRVYPRAERTPEDLSPSISTEGNLLSIEPLLLNRGDSFSISLVTDGAPGVPEAKARILGIPRVTRIESSNRLLFSGLWTIVGGFFGALFVLMLDLQLVRRFLRSLERGLSRGKG